MNLLLDIRYVLLPETILTLTILLCSVLTFLLNNDKQKLIYYVSLFGLFLALFSFVYIPVINEYSAFGNSFISNYYTVLFRILILAGSAVTLLLIKKYISNFKENIGEFYVLILVATLGAMLLTGANDLVMLFIAMETLSLSSYALCGYTKFNKLSNEAALKYLIIGAASTAIMLYGFSFLYGITASTNFFDIYRYLTGYGMNAVLILSFLLILGGFSYKLAAVPFHTWAPDVYQGSPVPVAAFLSVVSKTAGFAIIIRFMSLIFKNIPVWGFSIAIIAVLTMTIGNLMAISQSNIKRLMAYSSIAQSGYILIGLAIATNAGISSMIFYLITYLFMNFGVWIAIEIFTNQTGKDSIEDFNGLAFKRPYFAIGLTICLMSLAGIPLTAGFMGKFYLFQAVISAGFQFTWLLIAALINTIISIYYYLRIVKAMFLKPQSVSVENLKPLKPLNIIFGFMVVAVILLGILASPFISISQFSAKQLIFYNYE
ncbi:MAG: NADH-quinone oxidoreductase subunit NuoN [bacterium]